MLKHRILLMLLALCCFHVSAQTAAETEWKLSDSSFASVLYCGPGVDYYESFGHCALRVCDSINGIDVVYNYGSFNFSEPHFYLHFTQGKLNYFVEPVDFTTFMLCYTYYGQAIWEQQLNLSHSELESLYKDLEWSARPENKHYLYDPFWNNCATKVRDIIEKHSEVFSEITGPDEKWDLNSGIPRTTYRDLMYKYTDKTLLWWRLGTDILLGARCDKPMNKRQFMYMPIDMMTILDTTRTADGQAATQPRRTLAPQVHTVAPTLFTPTLCFLLLFVAVTMLTLLSKKKGWKLVWLDAILFAAAALLSLLIAYLWFGSDHVCTKWNFNILWANPIFLWLLCRLRKPCRLPAIIAAVCLLLALLVWIVGWPQQLNTATILIALTLLARVWTRTKKTER